MAHQPGQELARHDKTKSTGRWTNSGGSLSRCAAALASQLRMASAPTNNQKRTRRQEGPKGSGERRAGPRLALNPAAANQSGAKLVLEAGETGVGGQSGHSAQSSRAVPAPARVLHAAAAAPLLEAARSALDEVAVGAGDLLGLHLASAVDDLELDLLALHERTEARRMDRGLVHEQVVVAVGRGDEAEALLSVEPAEAYGARSKG